jgi:hypothetical protein
MTATLAARCQVRTRSPQFNAHMNYSCSPACCNPLPQGHSTVRTVGQVPRQGPHLDSAPVKPVEVCLS